MVEIEVIQDTIELIKMSDERYFSAEFKDYISNSRLGFINEEEGGSKEKFLTGFKSEYSDSFELGSAVHSIILQPESYYISEITKPSGKLGVFVEKLFALRQEKNFKIKDAIPEASLQADYYAGSLTPTRWKTAFAKGFDYYKHRYNLRNKIEEKLPLYLSDSIKAKAKTCIAEIYNNPKFIEKLTPTETKTCFNEYAIFCEVEVRIDGVSHRIKIKGKLDNFTIDTENRVVTLNDLKTSGKPAKFFMGNMVKELNELGEKVDRWYNGSFQTYHYYRQIALYAWLLQNALKVYYDIEGYKLEVNMLVVETTPNFKSGVFKVKNSHIKQGLNEFKSLITKVVEWKLQGNL